jgi:hypothetical protein
VRRQERCCSIELGGGGAPAGDVDEPPPHPADLLRRHRPAPQAPRRCRPAGNTQLPRPAACVIIGDMTSTALGRVVLLGRSEEMGPAQPMLQDGSGGLPPPSSRRPGGLTKGLQNPGAILIWLRPWMVIRSPVMESTAPVGAYFWVGTRRSESAPHSTCLPCRAISSPPRRNPTLLCLPCRRHISQRSAAASSDPLQLNPS